MYVALKKHDHVIGRREVDYLRWFKCGGEFGM